MLKKIAFIFLNFLPTIIVCENKDVLITIFVHGSFSLKPHLNVKNILRMVSDSIEESVYYRSTEINRRDPFFYKNQAMAGLGLLPIDINSPTIVQAAPTVAFTYEYVSHRAGYPESQQYYTFGWSGLVSNKLRYIEAGFLYKDLEKLVKKYKKDGYNPRIRILGYSHGGNLILQLGAIYQTKPKAEQFQIDEFHLIGTPIQVETDYLVMSPIFKKVYNWYSRSDSIQSMDFFSYKRFFSKKKFVKRCNFSVPSNLYQIRLKISKFVPRRKKVLDRMPQTDKELKTYFKEINYDPGHFELWFMGWTTLRYRQDFPINPLPAMIFLPLITAYLDEHPEVPHDLVAFFQPDFERIELTTYRHNRQCKTFKRMIPFVEKEIIQQMKEKAWKFTPEDYTLEIYNRKVYDAIKIVRDELNAVKKWSYKKVDAPKSVILKKTNKTYEEHLKVGKK